MVTALVGCVALAGCSSAAGSGSATPAPPSASSSSLTGSITVLAATPLQKPFARIVELFEAAHPGASVTLVVADSTTLATEVVSGVPADVFAAASPGDMARVIRRKFATSSQPFAVNVLEIAVPPTNPAHVTTVGDLGRTGIRVAVCRAVTPCGLATLRLLATTHVRLSDADRLPDDAAVVASVASGAADAGVVYVTDIRTAGASVDGVPIPAAQNASTAYPIATLTHSADPTLAQAFVAFVLSPAGRHALGTAGFGRP
jgi:molybdate transport system substrate-binding protein